MYTNQFNADPLADQELFTLLKDSFSDDASCWEAVREAQEAYKDLRRRMVLLEMEDERTGRNQEDSYAA